MRRLRGWTRRIAGLLPSARRERELADELDAHLALHIDDNLRRGMTPEEARRDALLKLGGVESTKQMYRERRSIPFLESALHDFRFTLRQLRKNPGFTATAVFILALGISSSVAIFAFVEAALIKPLPYPDQSRLVGVYESSPGYVRGIVSYRDFADWNNLNHVFSSIGAYAMNGSFTLTTATGAEQVPGTRVSSAFFHTLGVVPMLGRDFVPREDSDAEGRTVILSYAAWQKRFGGKQDAIGARITLNGAPTTIVGVLPAGFQFALYGGAEFWGNLRGTGACEQSRSCRNLTIIARLKDGMSIAMASAEMQTITGQLQKRYPDEDRDIAGATLVPLRDLIVGDVRPVLMVLLVGAALLLIIACVNVSTLLLARSDQRRREFAVRGALGASSARLFSQFAMEGLVLAALGCCLGLASAHWGMLILAGVVPADKLESMPFLRAMGLSPLATIAGCGVSVLAGVLFAIIPITGTVFSDMIEGLKDGTRGSAGTAWRRFGSHLVVMEVAVAVVLMAGAGLLGKSLYLLLHLDVGFTADHLASVQTSWSPTEYQKDPQLIALERSLIERVSMVPGVKSVALSTAPPIDSAWGTASFHIAGQANHGETNDVINRQISAGYFATLEARLFRGRYFRDDEDLSKPLVAIVNRTLAQKYFSGEDPVGKLIFYDWQPRSPDMEIVGVVEDVKEGQLEGANLPALYVPITQTPVSWPCVLVRTSPQTIPLIVSAIHRIDPFITVSEGQLMTERINQSPSAYLRRSSAFLVGLFAGAALLLSVVGLYGMVAYSVSQRTREIGIRMALGALPGSVYRLILKEAGWLTAAGIGIGLACSVGAAMLMQGLLFGVRSWDAETLGGVVVVLGISALLASYVPARRAASINPVEALHTE